MDRRKRSRIACGLASTLLAAGPFGLSFSAAQEFGLPALTTAGISEHVGKSESSESKADRKPAPRPLPAVNDPRGALPTRPVVKENTPPAQAVVSTRSAVRLSEQERQNVAAAQAAAEALQAASAAAAQRGETTANEFALHQDAILRIRLAIAALHKDADGRRAALRDHADAFRALNAPLERRAATGDAAQVAEWAAGRALQTEAEALRLSEAGDAIAAKRAWKRATDAADDLWTVRHQEARWGTATLEQLADALHLKLRVAEHATAGASEESVRAAFDLPLEEIHKLLEAAHGDPRGAAGVALVQIELDRARWLAKHAQQSDGAAEEYPSDAERAVDAAFRNVGGGASAPLDRARRMARVWQRREEFHDRLAGRTIVVSQILRNESTRNLASLTALADELRDTGAPRMGGQDQSSGGSSRTMAAPTNGAPPVRFSVTATAAARPSAKNGRTANSTMPGGATADGDASARRLVVAHLETLTALRTLKPIERRVVADRTADNHRPAATASPTAPRTAFPRQGQPAALVRAKVIEAPRSISPRD